MNQDEFDEFTQPEIEARGLEIFTLMKREVPGAFSQKNVVGRLMDWSMRNEALKVQLFRFVDVLPSLGSAKEIARHASEYLGNGVGGLPAPVRWALQLSPKIPWLTALAARQGVSRMAKTFILARTGAEAIPELGKMRRWPLAFTMDILGETAVSEKEAEQYQVRYLELIESLATEAENWTQIEQIDCDDQGPIPRVNVSVKISALYSQIYPADPEGSLTHLAARLLPLLMRAKERGVFINFDMENTALKDLTLNLFKRLFEEPALSDYPHAGIALQAYLPESGRDLNALIDWSKAHRRRITVRLIKGAYWDYEMILAQQRGWPRPVFGQKPETDGNYERLAGLMLENERFVNCAFGTHSVRSIAACMVLAEKLGASKRSYEFQMLYGMAEPIKRALIKMGYRVRDYCPVGEVLPGMSYLVRRLLENTSNEGFLRAAFSEHASPHELLRDPMELLSSTQEPLPKSREVLECASPLALFPDRPKWSRFARNPQRQRTGALQNADASDMEPRDMGPMRRQNAKETSYQSRSSQRKETHSFCHESSQSFLTSAATVQGNDSLFPNEPPTDFTHAASRQSMTLALETVRGELGRKYPLVIGGKGVWTSRSIRSINPARPNELIGEIAKGGKAEADAALASAEAAFAKWSKTAVEERVGALERAAALMRKERFRLAALEVFETGKNWMESDTDVAEAIDFCNFYAQEMRRIAFFRYAIPGETSIHHYIPRGIGVVIAPWNFPLAILCGMTTASIVTGNCVILKPSEQSSVVAAWFVDILRRAGVPPGVVNFLPGPGEEVGAYLVNHPHIDLIAFTGSREVGLKIYEAAGQTRPGQRQLKKVICEMGGKNAVIIDSDADLDEAIPGVIHSAFGYQGQKCSALSRLIVLKDNYERVLSRLIEASRSLQSGLPEHPATMIGPLIDQAAYDRVRQYLELGKQEAELAFQGTVPGPEGYFVPPTIFTEVPPQARIAQEEIFGPVLCVLKAKNLNEALTWANDTQYALTGGFYSRSPANIERVKAGMQVGNLYINRGITGALVARHPFGGFKMSGGGTKAGGRDYLRHFLFPRVITENRMRRGFAPEES